MKYIISILCSILVLNSCQVDTEIISIANTPVVNVSLPDTLRFQQTEIFLVDYNIPSTCHRFERFDITTDEQTITIRTKARYDETLNCQATPENVETSEMEFKAESLEDYTFRFLSGASSSTGQLEYIIVEVPVKQE